LKKVYDIITKKRLHICMYYVFLILILVSVVKVNRTDTDDRFLEFDSIAFSDGWQYEFEGGDSGVTSLPVSSSLAKQGLNPECHRLFLKNTIPKLDEKVSFFFRARHTAVRIYVDGKVVMDRLSEEKAEEKWYNLEGIFYHEIQLSPKDSGKELVIESYATAQYYLSTPGNVYLGDRGTFFMTLIRNKVKTLICACVLFLVSVLLLIMWILVNWAMHSKVREMLCLSWFTMSVSLWLFTETELLQFVFRDTRGATVLAYEILMLMPTPIALYFTHVSIRPIGKILSNIAATVPLVVFVINNGLHLLHIASLPESMFISQTVLGLETLFIAWVQISEIRYIRKVKLDSHSVVWKVPMLGILLFVPLAFIEIMKYMFAPMKYANDGILISVGVTLYILSLVIDTTLRVGLNAMKLKENTELKTQFLANMSHEIRTPLNAILGFNEVIIRTTKEEKTRRYANNIHEAGESLKNIINSILDISKIESGKLEIYSTEYSALQLLNNVTSIVATLAKKKGLNFIVDVDSNLPEILIGDEAHIHQVLINILNNAVKYTDSGSVTFTVKLIDISPDAPICKVFFSVKDTGIGIRDEDRDKLFEKFERLNLEKNAHTEGTGLGMSIVVQLLRAMGSEIQLKSEYGKGSEFFFELEQCVTNKSSVGNFEEKRKLLLSKGTGDKTDFQAPKARVLVVDDVQMNLDSASALLEFTKIQVDTALSGQQAIEMVRSHVYDLIFMDHMMPGMDGIEATNQIRELAGSENNPYYATVPIIALTANAMVGMKEVFLKSGMQDFLSKPIEIANLNKVMKTWLPYDKVELLTEEQIEEQIEEQEDVVDQWKVEIPCIQMEKAKEFNANFEGFEKNLKRFLDAYEETRKKLEEYRQAEDIKNFTIAVHGLKSTSKMIGAMELSEKALEMEEMGHREELSNHWEKLESLFDRYGQCIASIRDYLKLGKTEEKSSDVISLEDYETLMERIKTAAENFDMGEFMAMEDELSQIVPPVEKQEEFFKIKKMVTEAAFGDVTSYFES